MFNLSLYPQATSLTHVEQFPHRSTKWIEQMISIFNNFQMCLKYCIIILCIWCVFLETFPFLDGFYAFWFLSITAPSVTKWLHIVGEINATVCGKSKSEMKFEDYNLSIYLTRPHTRYLCHMVSLLEKNITHIFWYDA